MVFGLTRTKLAPSNKNDVIKIDKLFPDKTDSEPVNGKNKLLALPSCKIKNTAMNRKKNKNRTKKSGKAIKRDVTLLFDRLIREAESYNNENSNCKDYSSLSGSGPDLSSDDSFESNHDFEPLAIGKTASFELNEIYEAIDSINKVCLDPIKFKIKRDYIRARNSENKSDSRDEIKYSADINIVLSNRKEAIGDNVGPAMGEKRPNHNDFTVTVESISDTSKSDTPPFYSVKSCDSCELKKQVEDLGSDSVRSLDKLRSPSNTSDANSSVYELENLSGKHSRAGDNRLCPFYDTFSNEAGSGYKAFNHHDGPENSGDNDRLIGAHERLNSEAGSVCDRAANLEHSCNGETNGGWNELVVYEEDRPYFGRTLFYRFHGTAQNAPLPNHLAHYRDFKLRDPNCLSPRQLGFDSAQSLSNSVNAISEIIIKPPVTIGKSISFRSNVSRCVLSRDKFISDSVFQINWLNPAMVRRRRSFLNC